MSNTLYCLAKIFKSNKKFGGLPGRGSYFQELIGLPFLKISLNTSKLGQLTFFTLMLSVLNLRSSKAISILLISKAENKVSKL